jgi:hypothetical protein
MLIKLIIKAVTINEAKMSARIIRKAATKYTMEVLLPI